jgi:hypothetical protein
MRENITNDYKMATKKANGHKVFQMVITDMKNFNQGLPKHAKIGGFGLKINHLATLRPRPVHKNVAEA